MFLKKFALSLEILFSNQESSTRSPSMQILWLAFAYMIAIIVFLASKVILLEQKFGMLYKMKSYFKLVSLGNRLCHDGMQSQEVSSKIDNVYFHNENNSPYAIEWIHWNKILPTLDEVLKAYKLLHDKKDLNDEQENLLNWFITTVLLIVPVVS